VSTWGKSDPEDELEESSLELQRVGGRALSGRLIVVGLAVVLLVGALWIKPWEAIQPGPPQPAPTFPPVADAVTAMPTATADSSASSEPAAEPTATPDPLVVAAQRRQCQSPTDWRLVTAETTVTRETRTMYAATPVQASGPTDPSLPLAFLHADSLRAVGVCVPRSPVVSPTTTLHEVVLWQVESDGVIREIQRPLLMDPALYDIGEAYFSPPLDEGATWPPGRYVFEIKRVEGAGSRWMALEFVTTRAAS